jgi:hypothetical protein
VAVLIDALEQPAWVRELLAGLRASSYAELALAVRSVRAAGSAEPLPPRPAALLWRIYGALDRSLFRVAADPFARSDASALLDGVPRLDVAPEVEGDAVRWSEGDLERVRGHALDVVLHLGATRLRGPALQVARYGVWSCLHGSEQASRGAPLGFWEVMEDAPLTGSGLEILADAPGADRAIYRSWSPTYRYSVHRNRCNVLWKTAQFMPRKLRDLHALGEAALAPVAPGAAAPPARPARRPPSSAALLGLLPRLAIRILGKAARKVLYRNQWTFAWRLESGDRMPDQFQDVQLVIPARGETWADPFPVEHEGHSYLFIEQLPAGARHAHIAVMELDARQRWTAPRPVLERPYHLSYPFVFQLDGAWYMIPETSAAQTVELYRCVQFPDRWALERVLIEGVSATDATLHRADGRWWMFVNVKPPGCTTSDELSIYHADALLGPWSPHPRNPVKSDARSSRPAGRLFTWDGELYRPSQDCSRDYGSAIVINRVRHLSLDAYAEEAVHVIAPRWDPRIERTHTLNRAGRLTVIDGFRSCPRWKA